MPTTIIGVDYSGAKEYNRNIKTWIARGRLTDGNGALWLNNTPRPIRREELYKLLVDVKPPAVAAMDFPFGLPAQFIAHIADGENLPSTMDAVWNIVSAMDRDRFIEICTIFVANRRAPNRTWDAQHFSESSSPLKRANPDMRPMTYEGIRLLWRLHQECLQRWYVPPLEPTAPDGETVTLLEVMPGAALNAVGLPYRGYKNNTGLNALDNLKNRKYIIDNLSENFGIALPDLPQYRDLFIFNDDALDAYIASIVAALWQKDKTAFHRPEDHAPAVLADARYEGCIYAPERRRD